MIDHDGERHVWGNVSAYEPHEKLVLNWHVMTTPDKATEVAITFTQLDGERTRVDLEHRNWDVLGDEAADRRDGYDSGWVGVFEEAYVAACG